MKISLFGLLAVGVVGAVLAADPLSTAIDIGTGANREAAASQERIDEMAGQTQSIAEQYRQVLAQTYDLKAYNEQIQRLIDNQKVELESLGRQNGGTRITQQRLVPLLQRMVGALDQILQLDMPFLKEERAGRVQALKELLDQPEVSLTEKYRRVMEAYQVEIEYGRTIEAYTEPLVQDGDTRTVNFLRVGRTALLYASLDGAESGYWDRTAKVFKPLPAEFNREIERGLQIARKEAPPDLLKIPLPPPEVAK
ncbi:MAG: DUF3450 domain-containing protein [Chromatiales bacterium]